MEPILVHIGYHKTGTNWLQRAWWGDPSTGYQWLGKPRRHPVRRLVLEPPFTFDAARLRASFDELIEPIREQGLVPVVSFERLTGHPFSGGYDAKEIADRLERVFPEARILVVIREQRSMIVSTYKQYVRVGGTFPVNRFVDSPRSGSARMAWFDYRHFEYDHLIRYYQELYGRDAVLALPYELLGRDGCSFVDRIATFAGSPLPDDVLARLPFAKPLNAGRPAATLDLVRRLNRLTASELNPAPIADLAVAGRLARRLRRPDVATSGLLAGVGERAERRLRAQVADAVGDRYVESNRRTAQLTGFDLGELGWPV